MNDRLTEDAQKKYYDDRWAAEKFADKLKLIRCVEIISLLLMANIKRPKILELGCGTGWLTAILGEFGPAKGLELSPKAVEQASSRYTHVEYEQVNLAGWEPSGDEKYDVIVSHEVLEHLEAQNEHLDQAHALLNDNGYLILTTPNAKTMFAVEKGKRERWTTQPIENWVTRSELRSLLGSCGFSIQYESSCILGHGTTGIDRIVNSNKFIRLISALGLRTLYDMARSRFDFGLHLVVLAKKV